MYTRDYSSSVISVYKYTCTQGATLLSNICLCTCTHFLRGGGGGEGRGRDQKSPHPSFLLLFITHWLGTEIITAWTVSGVYPTGICAKFTCFLHVWRPPCLETFMSGDLHVWRPACLETSEVSSTFLRVCLAKNHLPLSLYWCCECDQACCTREQAC